MTTRTRTLFKLLILSATLSYPYSAWSETATLDKDLNLNLPLIRHLDNGNTHYYWARLQAQANADGLSFNLRDYGSLDAHSRPPALLDLADVTTDMAPAIVDIQAHSARLSFRSSIPLACAVIYGTRPELGQIATDSTMNGGALVDHNPILSDLQASTLYYYRVQGSDAQGNLYWSPLASFETPAAQLSANLLALSNGAYISAVSSNFGGASNEQNWGANKAIDESSATAWSSAGDGDQAFIEISLQQRSHINTLSVWSRAMNDGSAKILSFKVQIDDGSILGPFTLPDTLRAYDFKIDRSTASLRLMVESSTGGNTGLVDIAAY